jgi:predicted nucleic acid-binding protein
MRVVVDTNVFVSAALKTESLPAIALHLVGRYHAAEVGADKTVAQAKSVMMRSIA